MNNQHPPISALALAATTLRKPERPDIKGLALILEGILVIENMKIFFYYYFFFSVYLRLSTVLDSDCTLIVILKRLAQQGTVRHALIDIMCEDIIRRSGPP